MCVNGAIHWIYNPNAQGKVVKLASIDVKDETFQVMRLLKGVCEHHYLVQVGDHLSVLDCDGFRSEIKIRLWTLEDYHNDKAWSRQEFDFPFGSMMYRRPNKDRPYNS